MRDVREPDDVARSDVEADGFEEELRRVFRALRRVSVETDLVVYLPGGDLVVSGVRRAEDIVGSDALSAPRVGSGRPSERGDGGPPPPSTFIRIRRSSPWFFRTVSGSSSRLSSSAGGFSAIASWSGRLRSWTLQRDVAGISHRPGSGVGFSPPWVAERVDPRSHQHVHRSRPT